MTKNSKRHSFTPRRAAIIACIVAIPVLAAAFAVKILYLDRYIRAAEMAETVPIRELVLQAAEQLKTDAVVDPQTGALYFPEAKLFIAQNQPIFGGLTYDITFGQSESELSISSRGVFSQASVPLYTAKNTEEVFKAIPKLQACWRGIRLVYAPIAAEDSADIELSQTVRLNNGKDLYLYTEKGCPELNDVAIGLKNIQAY